VMLPLGRHNYYQVRPPCLSESRASRICSYAHDYEQQGQVPTQAHMRTP